MGIERLHDDFDTNRRQRLLAQGSLEERVALLEQLVFATVERSKLPKKVKDKIKKVEDAEKKHPEKDD